MRLNCLRAEGILGGNCSHPHTASGICTLMPTVIHTHTQIHRKHTWLHTPTPETLKTQTWEVTCRNSAQRFSQRGVTQNTFQFISNTHQEQIQTYTHTHKHKSSCQLQKNKTVYFRKGPQGLGPFYVSGQSKEYQRGHPHLPSQHLPMKVQPESNELAQLMDQHRT